VTFHHVVAAYSNIILSTPLINTLVHLSSLYLFIMLTGIAHVNLTVPTDTLDEAEAFYSNTLGMQRVPVPVLQKVSHL
jgi:catechol-2,3-dioxygenase